MEAVAEKRFAEAVEEVLDEYEWSVAQLVRVMKDRYDWGSESAVGAMLNGFMQPSLEALQNIAGALEVDPASWPEYRMALLREELNPLHVGYEAALKRLNELER